jgi:uncharacterized protein
MRIIRSGRCPFTSVQVRRGFWLPRMQTNRAVTVPYCFQRCEETGRISNFVAAAQRNPAGFRGIFFDDSDVFKIVEGASYTLALHPDPELEHISGPVDRQVRRGSGTGWVPLHGENLGFPRPCRPESRWTGLDHSHELCNNVGHMYEAAVAHYEATGKRSLLDIALKNADLVCRGLRSRSEDQRQRRARPPADRDGPGAAVPRHRREKYLDLARFFVDMRGRQDLRGHRLYGTVQPGPRSDGTEQTEAVGHAVRGGYFYAGVADVAATHRRLGVPSGHRPDLAGCDRTSKLYLIGSVGQHGAGEGYAGPYQADQSAGLQRNLRVDRVGDVEPPHVPAARRQQVRGRAGTDDVQRVPGRRFAGRAIGSSTRTRSPAI